MRGQCFLIFGGKIQNTDFVYLFIAMNIIYRRVRIILLVAVLFSVYGTSVSIAATPVEEACLKFVDDLWFTRENARINTPAKGCYWNDDSFRVRGVIVRTYMTLDFYPDF